MIGQAINLGSFFLDIAKRVWPESADINAAANAAGQARQAYNVVSTTSVHQSASRAIIAPMTCIENSLIHQEYMSDLMQIIMLRDIVATLTHLAMQNTVGMNVKVENIIGSISPNRAGLLSLAGCEALDTNIKKEVTPAADYVSVGGKTVPDLYEFGPLAVGKVVMATLHQEGGGKIDFPLTFRQIPIPVPLKELKTVFSAAKVEEGFWGRLLMLKTREITSPEFLSGSDIIKERFRIKNEEMAGYYKEALRRESGNRAAAIRTGVVSMNTLANSFIMSQDAANQLELDIGKRFSNPTSRKEIFKAVKANTIVVCNEDRGIFTFYTHGSDMHETYTRKDISGKSKKDQGSNTLADLVKILNS